jgi:hypothetical protein
MKFENHVFISYAHLDNARLTGIEKGWVDQLRGDTNGMRVRGPAATARSHRPPATQPEVT